ncbi:MAG: hypothetical protein JXA60_11340 [Candidatus Coatesbacteria bacterium]|nr:hypothetical protein [Candidatus Coatesbacteria bacterium]
MRYFITIVFLFTSLHAMFEDYAKGPKGLGLGDAFYTMANDPTAIFYNPAGLADLEKFNAQAGFGNKYQHQDLNELFLAATYNFNKLGTAGIGLSQIGPSFMQERQVIIAHGIEIAPYLKAGYSLQMYQITQDDGSKKESATAFGGNLGILSRIYERWQFGFSLHNISEPEIGQEGEKIPQSLAAGVSYFFASNICTNINLRAEGDKPVSILAGQEFGINEYFSLRAGLGTEPRHISGGLSLKYKYVDIIYGANYIENLPLSHNVSLNFSIPQLTR